MISDHFKIEANFVDSVVVDNNDDDDDDDDWSASQLV